MPRLGLATIDISALGGSGDTVTTIDDFFFESFSAGEMHPMLTTSRTNLVLQSETWNNASWSKNAATVQANQIASPLDLNAFTADLLKEDNTNAEHWVRSNNITASLGQTFTMSFYAKAKERTFVKANFLNSGVVSYNVWINLSNGAITSKNSNLTVTTELIGSGFYRITLTAQAAATTLNLLVQLATGDGVHSYAGDGSSGAYVFGAQVEQDSFVSNYIPTVGSTVSVSTPLNDTSEVWDFDGTDIMLAEDPEDEGFWEEGSNLVLNHSFEDLGSEIVANGTFDLGSELTPASDFASDFEANPSSGTVSQSNGTVTFDNATSTGTQVQLKNRSISAGKMYQIQFTISNYSSGNFRMSVGNQTSDAASANGTHTFYVQYNNGLARNYFYSNNSTLTVSDISVKEIGTWTTLGTGASITNDVFTSDGTSGNYDNILVGATTETWDTSEYYEVTFDVPSYTSGNFKLNNSTHNITNAISASGSYKVYFKPSTANTIIGVQNAGTPFKGSIDNISVKQVDPNDRWNVGTGWTISDGKAHADTSGTAALSQTISTGAGNTYEVTFTISNFTTGVLQPQFDGILATPTQINSNGTHTVKITAAGSSHGLLLYAIGTSEFSIDNVTIKEYAIKPKDI